ncbi:MAG TPA: PD-(D/E)XK nuclease family protein [Oligoflexia bacterium]|nr:PD-(D/E)XK nuclease family protein [Oligoflexia bacterium]
MQQGLLFDQTSLDEEKKAGQAKVYHHFNSLDLKHALFKDLLQQKREPLNKEKTYILVHSNLLANHLKYSLGQDTLPNYPLYFITFFDLAKMILSKLGMNITKPVLDKTLSLLKLHDLCQDFFNYDVPNSSLNFLNNKPAFIHNLLSNYTYLDKQSISHWPNEHEDLLALYKKYQKDFFNHYYTQDSFLKHVSSCLEKADACLLPHTLLVYGFYDFSPVQTHLLSKTQFSKKSLYLLTDSPANKIFSSLPSQSIAGDDTQKTKPSIPVHTCNNEQDELNTLKTFMLAHLKDNSKQLNKIAVLLPNQHYLELCKNLFKQHCIPYHCPIGNSMEKTNLGKILNLLIQYNLSKKEQADLTKLILDFPGKKDFLVKKEILFLLKKNHVFNQKILLKNEIKEFSKLKHLLEAIDNLFEQTLSYNYFFESFLKFVNHFIDQDCLSNPEEHSHLFDLQKYLKTLEGFNSEFKSSSLVFALKQFLSLKCSDPLSKKMYDNGVFLAPIDYAAFFSFDDIYILGLNQQAFPKPDQLLNLLTIEKPNLAKPPIVYQHEKDIAIFKQLLISCKNANLFYGQHDQLKDQALQKSVVFDYIESHPANSQHIEKIYSSVIDYQKNKLSSDLKSMSEDEVLIFAENNSWLPQQINWMQSYLSPQPSFDAMSGHLAILPEKNRDTFSVTALQRYATCPYQYFLHDVLDLQNHSWPEDIYGLHPLEKGEILHQILFLFYQRCLNQQKVSLEQKTIWLKEIFENLNSQHGKYTLKKPPLWPLEQLGLYQRVKSFIAYEHLSNNDFYPLALEMRFGSFKSSYEDQNYSKDEALCLNYKNKKLYFRGKIDRIDIDLSQQHLHVIDYKSGKITAKNNDFAQGKTIQMAIYLLLCQKYFKHIPLKNMHARMVSVDPKQNFSEKHLSGEYLEQHLDDFYQLIFSLSQRINQGIFFQQPGNNAQHCQFCDYQMICQSNVVKRSQLIQKSPELINILEKSCLG